MKTIPEKITIGGQEIAVSIVPNIEGNFLGDCCLGGGYIRIANIFNNGIKQSGSSKLNTFYHELIHCILDSMGSELSKDEKFVSTFAALLTDAMISAEYATPAQ